MASHRHHDPLPFGEAIAVTLLLSDWDKFGLSERVCYHFDLIETLTASSDAEGKTAEYAQRNDERNISAAEDGVCGVVSLMECVPKAAKYRRKDLRSQILSFNMHAQQVQQEAKVACHEPSHLPLKLSPYTRVSFAYEVTKVAFVLDASPTLVTTFGNGLGGMDDDTCCALDSLDDMTRTFFKALVKPITAPWLEDPKGWRPIIAVTVLAVYPHVAGASDTSLLVRDFRVYDIDSAERLSKEIARWALKEVENEIALRMGHTGTGGYDSWSRPSPSSSLRDIFDAGDTALSLLPSHARPCIVLATDCRSVMCENILDVFNDSARVDTPLVVLDLSSSSSHVPMPEAAVKQDKTSLLSYDPGSSLNFPLHLSDDSELLFGLCRATGGAFFDSELLKEAARTVAGKASEDSPITADSYFAFKRRALRPNAIQWYTLFSLSPLTQSLHPAWGKLVSPTYIQQRLRMISGRQELSIQDEIVEPRAPLPSQQSSWQSSLHSGRGNALDENPLHRRQAERTIFSMYVVSPVRVKGLLLLRIKEGYRAKQYGQSTYDPDKVSIQLTLPLELGTVLHYELSYIALQDQSPLQGVANVKIELSGEKSFIQTVKNDFISNAAHVQRGRPSTIAMKASARLCKVLRGVRKEDCLQAYLCPLSWADKISTADCTFTRRLGTLSQLQRRRHFRLDAFDVVCVGRMPYELDDSQLLSEFINFDNGEQELFESLSEWSTQTIKEKNRYVKRTTSSRDDLIAYCVIEVTRSGSTSRIFTITVEAFGGSNAVDRLVVLSSLKEAISKNRDVLVLKKPMNEFLIGLRDPLCPELKLLQTQRFLESHFHHERWDGGPNPELLALLTKRRIEVASFWLIHSSDTYSLFAKLVTGDEEKLATADFTKASDSASSKLYQVQYQIAVISGSVVIDMHVERKQGVFFTQFPMQPSFHALFERVRRHDQECGRALGSRASLLALLNNGESLVGGAVDSQLVNVERLLKYASRVSRRLRFFHSGASIANKVLEELTVNLMLSDSFHVQVKQLPLDVDAVVSDVDHGIWFLMQFDAHTMGMAHLESSERQANATDDQPSFMYRNLTFFTIGISDLYCKRDLIADDDSTDDHISEFMCVSEFADEIEACQGKNYARAAYLALRIDANTQKLSFDTSDIDYALEFCCFVDIKSIVISQEIRHAETQSEVSNLSRAITSVLAAVPGDKYCLFYPGDELHAPREDADVHTVEADDESSTSDDGAQSGFSDDGTHDNGGRLIDHESNDASSHGFSLSSDESAEDHGSYDILPPIFVRLSLDDELVAPHEIARADKTATLTARMSVFDPTGALMNKTFESIDPSDFPEPHYTVALRIRSLLDSYVAEQLLERFREYGPSVSRGDLKTVKKCLRRARHVLSRDVRIQIYDAKLDSMIRPPAQSGGNAEIEKALPLFCTELQNDGSIQLNPTSSTVFFVNDTVENSSALRYWCFVTVKMHVGMVNMKLYHPDGEWKAAEALSSVHDHVVRTTHRVNQILLLRSLHRNRTASSFLIPGDRDLDEWKPDEEKMGNGENSSGSLFNPGSFGCPVKFKTSFPLYHRCVAGQVIVSLEASVLDSFAVSNRRGVFVYKDESDAIFYMKLKAAGSDEGANYVELLVFGLHQPGPSVTRQLARILQRRLLVLAVDALSKVLSKNPQFNWKSSDVKFLRSFEDAWLSLEDEMDVPSADKDVDYALPSCVYDPIMLLLFFRQNICGSTFFHRLQEANMESEFLREDCYRKPLIAPEDDGGMTVPFDSREFALFYNNTPSPLDPELQPVSTLTDKGAEYSRKTGMGIALIEVTLIDLDGRVVQELVVGQSPKNTMSMPDMHIDSLWLRKVEKGFKNEQKDENSDYRIRVSIVDTALDRDALHNWVLLSLNQVLAAWVIERHIQRAQLGLLLAPQTISDEDQGCTSSLTDKERNVIIDTLKPGFPYLLETLNASHKLPHPAIAKLEMSGVIKASSVATVALGLVEKCLNGLTWKETREPATHVHESSETLVIRLSRTERPSLVDLWWDLRREKALVSKSESGIVSYVRDSPIDSPEYLCFYCSNSQKEGATVLSPSTLCFREVRVDGRSDGKRDNLFVEVLMSLRERNPSAFSRSLAFVLSVERNRRLLITYNWNPQVWKSVESNLKDTNFTHLNVVDKSVHSLQQRCLQTLSPLPTKQNRPGSHRQEKSEGEKRPRIQIADKEQRLVGGDGVPLAKPRQPKDQPVKTPSRRIQRPTSIRRPQLVGKSVEGAAMQAMAASRARASVTRFNPVGSSPLQKPAVRNKAVASKVVNTADQASQELVSFSRTRAGSTDDDQQADARSDQKQVLSVATLSMLRKEYVTAASRRLTSPFNHSPMIEATINKWWFDEPERPVHPLIRDFLLSRSVCMWSSAFELLLFPDRMKNDVSGYFAQWLKMSNPEYNLLQLDAPTRARTIVSPASTILIELKRFRQRKLCVALRTSLKYQPGHKRPIFRCEAWKMMLFRNDKVIKPEKSIRQKSIRAFEREAALMDKKIGGFQPTIDIESQFFNFSAFLIELSLQRWKESLTPAEMLPLLQDMVKRFPLERQLKMGRLKYTAFEAKLVLSSYANKVIDLFDSNRLFDHLSSNASSHEMIVCNTDGLCFAQPIPVHGTGSLCFLTRDPRIVGKMELVILCRMEGRRLNEYVFREGNPVGAQLLDLIAVAAAKAARDVLQAAAMNIRRDALWALFTVEVARRAPSNDELHELLRLISSGPLVDEDSRRQSVCFDTEHDYGVDWRNCFKKMAEDPVFSPHWAFQEDTATRSLFYMRGFDEFLSLLVNDDGSLREAHLLWRDKSREQGESKVMVGQVFSNYLVHYLWHTL